MRTAFFPLSFLSAGLQVIHSPFFFPPWFVANKRPYILPPAQVALSMRNVWEKNKTIAERFWVWYKVIKRIALLFLIGVFLNIFASNFDILKPFGIMGLVFIFALIPASPERKQLTRGLGGGVCRVLQRIGICYGVVSLLYMTAPEIAQWLSIVLFIEIYLLLMYGLDVPNCGEFDFCCCCCCCCCCCFFKLILHELNFLAGNQNQ